MRRDCWLPKYMDVRQCAHSWSRNASGIVSKAPITPKLIRGERNLALDWMGEMAVNGHVDVRSEKEN